MATAIRSVFDMTADSVQFRCQGYKFNAGALSTTCGDFMIETWGGEVRILDGAQLIVKNHSFGDKVTFQVVDADNRLALGAGYVVDEFGVDWYLASDKQDQGAIRVHYCAEVLGGLYIRVVYTNTGLLTANVCCNLFLHRVLR